ncbi:MAG: hypothetical protein RJQ09_03360 [Cyclobacteriaceae bacterium]
MRVIKSISGKTGLYQNDLEKRLGHLIGDLETYSDQIIDYLSLPGTSVQLKKTLRHAVKGLNNYDFDIFERLISFGRSLSLLVGSTHKLNKDIVTKIEAPLKYLVQTYTHIAFSTSHKEITDTASRLIKDISQDPNQISFVKGY